MNDDIQQYIDKHDSLKREILQKIRTLIKRTAPQATEAMIYGVPGFKLNGNLILYAVFKNHVGIYPEPETMKAFAKELVSYETTKGTIKFKLDRPIPYDLIKKIVQYRVILKLKKKS